MKRTIFILLVALTGTNLHAQETSLTLEVTPGKLASQLTEEQMSTVKELTLTGEMYNCDFYTIRDSMKILEKLDLSKVLADSIPIRGLSGMPNLLYMDFPATLKFIDEFAMPGNIRTITWWNYPKKIQRLAFNKCMHLQNFYASENNPDCVSIDGILYSKDKKKLLHYPSGKSLEYPSNYTVPDNLEVIAEGAFMDAYVRELTLPASVDRVEDKAFWVYLNIPTGYGDGYALSQLTCLSTLPPTIVGDPFLNPNSTELFVPEGSEKLYAQAPGWEQFHTINGSASYLIDRGNAKLTYWQENDVLHIQSRTVISEIELIDLNGNILGKYFINGFTGIINLLDKSSSTFYMMRITYQDKGTTIIKSIN